jgi:hypothetical protein
MDGCPANFCQPKCLLSTGNIPDLDKADSPGESDVVNCLQSVAQRSDRRNALMGCYPLDVTVLVYGVAAFIGTQIDL